MRGSSHHTAGDLAFEEYADEPAISLSLEAIRAAIIRNRVTILAAIVLFVVAAVAITALMRPQYTASASVQIDQQAAKVLGSEDESAAAFQDADRFLQTQVDILKSRSLAERVVGALGLDRDDRFIVAMGGKPSTPAAGTNPRAARQARAMSLLRDHLEVELPRTSRVATIRFTSASPKMAADVANAFAQQFIVANLQRRYEATSYARNFLQNRLGDVRRRLETSEREVNSYARGAGLIDASNAATADSNGGGTALGPRSLTTARLVDLNSALAAAQQRRTETQERWELARKTPVMSLPEVLANSAIQDLQQQRAQLRAAYEEERQRHRDDYPTLVQQAAKIAEIDKQIAQMASNVRRSISDAYQTALAQEQQIARENKTLERSTLDEQDRGVRFNILRREVDTNRELYNGLLQRYKELSAEAGVTTNNISIVDRAETPTIPTSPRPLMNLAIGLFLGLVTAAGIVFVREKFDDRIRLPEDVPAKLGLPLLGSIPKLGEGAAPRAELDRPRSEFAEAHQALRATLELSSASGVPRTLLVTSSRPSEGKSTTSVAVAETFARSGRRVLLVDLDLRRPSLHKVMGAQNTVGMSNVLAQQPFAPIVQSTGVEHLSFIPSGPIPPDPAKLLGAEQIAAVLATLADAYDLVVIDGPPVLGLADTLELAAATGGVLFVVEAGSMHFGGVRTSLKRLRDVRATMLGVVLNKFDVRAAGYSEDYYYNYTYRYGNAS